MPKNPKNWQKIVNTGKGNKHIFQMAWGISMKLSGKMYLIIILKFTKGQDFLPSQEKTILEELQLESNWQFIKRDIEAQLVTWRGYHELH